MRLAANSDDSQLFLEKSGSRRKSISDAITYGLSIIIIYLALGLIITGLFGAGKLNELSTNAWFNLAFFLLLVIFAISFFGGFDITLPSKWSNSVDSKAEKASGLISIFSWLSRSPWCHSHAPDLLSVRCL